jgi:acetyl esterase/lipase
MTHDRVAAVLEWMQGAVASPDADLEEVRTSYDSMAEPLPAHVDVKLAATAGLRGEWVGAPAPAPAPATLLYFHGGAYTIGSPISHRGLAGRLAHACAARVFVVDYRLAPEHVFPAAVNDAVGAWLALRELGIPPSKIVVGGDSAGGALALVVAMSARDSGEAPGAVFTFSAWTDLAAANRWTGDDPVLDAGVLSQLAAQYLHGADPMDWRASPVHGELANLPPLLMQVGERELLLADSRRFAAKAKSAGCRVVLEEYPGMIHVFQMYASQLQEARHAIRRVGAFVRRNTQ